MVQDLALQRNKYKHLSDEEWRWFLQQVEGRERTADKLPTFAAIDDWWYPVRLSCEQCSSEATARYKASILPSFQGEELRSIGLPVAVRRTIRGRLLDLTGGYGVDTYFLSEHFSHTDYVEQNAELCRIAAHNFQRPTPTLPKGKEITVHNCTAEEFLKNHLSSISNHLYDLIFLDPARRDSHGGKVFKLADCTPNVVELLPALLTHGKRIMIKLSPMLDITQAVTTLSQVTWDIYVVAIKNEVKEVLLLSGGSGRITAIDLSKKEQAFIFTREEESVSEAVCQSEGRSVLCQTQSVYLFEPNASILKAGAYKLVAQRFGLRKLDTNTHLYTSETLVENFPGRVWKVKEPTPPLPKGKEIKQATVLVRNYPLTAEQLKKKLHLRDGGTAFVIGCRVAGKPTVFLADRLQ